MLLLPCRSSPEFNIRRSAGQFATEREGLVVMQGAGNIEAQRSPSRNQGGDCDNARENDERGSITDGIEIADAVEHDAQQARAKGRGGGSEEQAEYHGP